MSCVAMKMDETPEIEVGFPSGRDLEDLAIWVAEAVDDWAHDKGRCPTFDPKSDAAREEVEAARQLGRALRVLGWMASIDEGKHRDVAAEESLVETLLRAFDLLLPTTAPESGERRNLTPIAAIALRDLRALDAPDFEESDFEDEETVVRRAMPRSTNRILR